MKLCKILPFVLLLLISASFAAAQTSDPAPVTGITAQPGTLVWNSVTIRVSATDRWPNAAISHIDFYVNGAFNATHNCGFQPSCIYTTSRVSGVQRNETYHAIVHDLSNAVQTQNLTVTFKGPNRPPNLSALPNISINEDSGNNTNLTDLHAVVTDDWTAPANLTYAIINQSNTTAANCTITNNQYIDCATVTQDAYGTSVITVTASDGQLTGTGNFTLTVLPVNDAPVFNVTIPAITFAEDTSYTFNISDYFYDVDNLASAFSFLPTSTGNITITYAYNNTLNKIQATLTPAQDWNGAVTTNFTASDGVNSSGPSNNVLITVTNVNDRPFFREDSLVHNLPNHVYKDVSYSFQINASDIDAGDVLTYYDNTTLFNIDINTGWINFTPNSTGNYSVLILACDDSGAANNCTNETWDFEAAIHPPIQFDNIAATPASPVAYSENATYNFTSNPLVAVPIGYTNLCGGISIWFEFNGTNYTVANGTNKVYVNLSNLSAGNYKYKWHGNFSCGLHYNSSWYNYTVDKGNYALTLSIPASPITYGIPANVSCNASTTQVTPVLMRNGTIVSNPDNVGLLGAGTYAYFCYANATTNYPAMNVSANLTITPIQVNAALSLQTPITYGTPVNVTCNASPSNVTPTLTRNGVALPGLTDTSVLGAGNYTYVCYYNTTQNYTGDNESQMLIVNPVQTVINLTLNGTNGNINVPANSTININATSNVPNATINWYLNGTLIGPIGNGWSVGPIPPGAYNVTAQYAGSQNYTAASATHWIFSAMPPMKMNFNPASGSTINTSFTLSFATTYNTSCRWSLSDQAYTAMTNDFNTTGQMAHSGTVSGLNLGADAVYVSCTGDTAGNNTDLNYFVQNIIEQGSTLTNGATANNSILYSTSVDNSTLQSVNATGSTIRGSILTNCRVVNSTVKNYQGTNCVIINSFVDPPNPGSDLTGSTITGNSRVMNSNATYSTITSSNITNSNVNNSQLTNSEVTASTVQACTLNNSQVSGGVTCNNSTVTGSTLYNITLINAVVNNGVLTSGTLILANGTNYTAPPNQNIANLTNLPPNGAFTYSRSNLQVNFNSGSSSDPNTGDTLTYFWDFGDGTNTTTTSATRSHTYSSAGTYNVTLTATDNWGATDPTPAVQQITVTAGSSSGGNTPRRIYGGGGGGGGGSSFYARTWKINLDERSPEIRTLNRKDKAVITLNNLTYTLRMDGIDRGHVNFTLKDIPYSLINYEIKTIDLDNDGISEIRIIIMNNYYTRAQIRFDKFEEKMGTTPAPLLFSNISLGMEENITEPPAQEEKESKIKQTITGEQNDTATNQITGEATSNWLDSIPKDSQTIGIGITIGVVIAGLIVYFIASALIF